MTNEEINRRVTELMNGDSNDEEIDGLKEIINVLQSDRDQTVFRIKWTDVEDVATAKGLPLAWSTDEQHVFEKCVESGMSCWSEVVELAIRAAISERSET